MAEILAWLLNRFRPREGWAALLLVLTAIFCLPAALLDSSEDLPVQGMLILTGLAAIIGLRLARSHLSARAATIWGGALGVGLAILIVGQLLPPLGSIWREFGYTVDWLGQGRPASLPPPFSTVAGLAWQRTNDLVIRLWWWGQSATGGATAQDPIAFQLLTSFLCWALGLLAVWQIYRHRKPLAGLLPIGVVVATAAFFAAGMALFYLLCYLFCTLWLVAICDLWIQQDRWERTETDYPGNLGQELVIVLAPWLLMVLLLAVFFPVIHPNQVREAFWRVMDGPWTRVEQVAEQLFGPIESGYPGPGGGGGPGGQLPRSHLLGSGPELGETVVLYVVTSDPPPPQPDPDDLKAPQPEPPRRYWRGQTYDTYTGLGWDNGPLQTRNSSPGEILDPTAPPGADLFQRFELLAESGQIYMVNAPLRIDQPVETRWRGPGDLAQATGQAATYTAISRPPQPTIAELRAAPDLLSPNLAERYLALPETVPQRVLDLAHDVAGNATNHYDQAHALEMFLRTYTYTLDLPPPPADRDVVDYFLYDAQEGYCDYYASAMAVMARAVGIPARLASGYAQGSYDHDTGRWIVTEKDGHSWVEVYFEGIGWVEFEPTAGQPALTRAGSSSEAISVPPKPPRVGKYSNIPWGLLALGGLLAGLIAIIAWIWLPRKDRDLAAAELIRDRHARLLRWGSRLSHPLCNGQTPNEYGHSLGDALYTQSRGSRWPQVRQAGADAPPEVEHLSKVFTQAQYSPHPPTEREAGQIRELWTRLRRRLWWLRLT